MNRRKIAVIGGAGLLLSGLLAMSAAAERGSKLEGAGAAVVEHPDCSYFANPEKFNRGNNILPGNKPVYRRSQLTVDVASRMKQATAVIRPKSFQNPDKLGTIDKYLLADMQAHGVTPA